MTDKPITEAELERWGRFGMCCGAGTDKPQRLVAEVRRLRTELTVSQMAVGIGDDAIEALRALVDVVGETKKPLDQAIFISTQHGFPYTGPNWGEELKKAKEVLDSWKDGGDGTDHGRGTGDVE